MVKPAARQVLTTRPSAEFINECDDFQLRLTV
jgi:hypothetical protein